MNLAAMVRNVAQMLVERRYAHRQFRYQGRACSTLSAMKDNLVRLLLGDCEQQRRLLEHLVLHLASAVDAVRPNRSFPRHNPGKLKPDFIRRTSGRLKLTPLSGRVARLREFGSTPRKPAVKTLLV